MVRHILCLSFLLLLTENTLAKQLYFGAPNEIVAWKISCKKVDSGSIVRKKNNDYLLIGKN